MAIMYIYSPLSGISTVSLDLYEAGVLGFWTGLLRRRKEWATALVHNDLI